MAAGPRTVLVVDDDRDTGLALRLLLELQGYRVLVVHRGRAALELVEREHPDVVLLDLGLPDLDGYEVLAKMRTRPGLKHTRFIALSGRDVEEQRSVEAGFHQHLLKPADLADLLRAIEG